MGDRLPGAKVLEAEATLTGSVGQRLDAAVIDVRAAIEDDFLDAGLAGALGDQLADSGGGRHVGTGLQRSLQVLLELEAAAIVCPFESSMIWA